MSTTTTKEHVALLIADRFSPGATEGLLKVLLVKKRLSVSLSLPVQRVPPSRHQRTFFGDDFIGSLDIDLNDIDCEENRIACDNPEGRSKLVIYLYHGFLNRSAPRVGRQGEIFSWAPIESLEKMSDLQPMSRAIVIYALTRKLPCVFKAPTATPEPESRPGP